MRHILALSALASACLVGQAQAQQRSFWNSNFNQGTMEYAAGTFDTPYGGAISISCGSDGGVLMLTQIKGKLPAPHSAVVLKTSNRSGSIDHSFRTDGDGNIVLANARRSPVFAKLWSNLRSRDIVTLRFADGQSEVLSLEGAAGTLPRMPCAE